MAKIVEDLVMFRYEKDDERIKRSIQHWGQKYGLNKKQKEIISSNCLGMSQSVAFGNLEIYMENIIEALRP